MTETRGQLPGTGRASAGDVRPTEPEPRRDERRAIGRRLHQGILQELTVAGLKLKALENQGTGPIATAIGEFAAWLRERQAELRRYVSALEQGLGDTTMETELASLADAIAAQHQCRLSIDRRVRGASFPQEIADAVVRAVRGVVPVLAGELNAHSVAIALDDGAEATLRIMHDGDRLQQHDIQLKTVRQSVGSNGASLRIELQQATETLILDWAN